MFWLITQNFLKRYVIIKTSLMLSSQIQLNNCHPHVKDGEGTVLTEACLFPHLGDGAPSPSHKLLLFPCPFLGGYPSDWSHVLSREYHSPRQGYPISHRDTPLPGRGYSSPMQWVPKSQVGRGGFPISGRG